MKIRLINNSKDEEAPKLDVSQLKLRRKKMKKRIIEMDFLESFLIHAAAKKVNF